MYFPNTPNSHVTRYESMVDVTLKVPRVRVGAYKFIVFNNAKGGGGVKRKQEDVGLRFFVEAQFVVQPLQTRMSSHRAKAEQNRTAMKNSHVWRPK